MRAIAVLVVVTALLAVAEVVLVAGPHYPRGVFAVFGLLGCVTIVVVSKLLGKIWLQRPAPSDE
ncbi:MAG: hypothetical protein HYU51_17060 [Candidatus Rokubacteria bacterium]|nr:hypothetical protein [Candidatus Rokubacteria bacterium]